VVPRYKHISYSGIDPQGNPINRFADGFHARVVQHECDHLIGRLYPSRIQDFSKFGYTEVLFPGLMWPTTDCVPAPPMACCAGSGPGARPGLRATAR
jgi:hypothetical protein